MIGLVAAVALVLVAVAVAVPIIRGRNGPAGQFERAAQTFHDAYDRTARSLNDKLATSSGGGFGDPSRAAVMVEAEKLADVFDAYTRALRAISFPAEATTAANQLIKVTDFGHTLMTNFANGFGVGTANTMLAEFGPKMEAALADAEKDLRTGLAAR
ncbi:hypothetical protein [Actinoplanes sp. NPDC049265]|uniref:hypothetical protein n=1 Tax=Actinoplanes sp. NPDC049265 TaxID=3363902 RepID=UPI0037244978